MKKIFKAIADFFHVCNCNKPILSQYVGFHTRHIIFECKCGEREKRTVIRAFSEPFPIETGMMVSDKEMEEALKNKKTLPLSK